MRNILHVDMLRHQMFNKYGKERLHGYVSFWAARRKYYLYLYTHVSK